MKREPKAPAALAEILPAALSVPQRQLELFNPDEIAFTARLFAQISLPHTKPSESQVVVRNGALSVTLNAPTSPGLPYGLYARRILAYLVTNAVRTQSSTVPLGRTFSTFAQRLQITPTTGRTGTLIRLKDQLLRMLSMTVLARFDERRTPVASGLERRYEAINYTVAARATLWWDADTTAARHEHTIDLSTDFFRDLIDAPVPFQLGALLQLQSTLAQDLYILLTYRALRSQRIGRAETIPFSQLQHQLNCGYAEPRHFRRDLAKRLAEVIKVYPEARVELDSKGLVLKSFRPHVPRLPGS